MSKIPKLIVYHINAVFAAIVTILSVDLKPLLGFPHPQPEGWGYTNKVRKARTL